MGVTPGDAPVVAGAGPRAAGWAAAEARRRPAPLRLLPASGAPPGRARGHPRAAEPVDALLARSATAALLVVGGPDRPEVTDLARGCTALTVAGRAHCPVVIVRGEAERPGYVLLAVADPGEAGAEAEFAFREAALRGCPVRAVRAWRAARTVPAAQARRRALRAAEEAVRAGSRAYPAVAAHALAGQGRASDVLLRAASRACLVVTGSRRPAPFGARVGMVPHTLLHHAPCPVAVVPRRP